MDDYISRAEFVRELDDIIARCNQIGVTDDFQYHELVGEENATKAIRCLAKAFPAADVRPVKRGKWLGYESDKKQWLRDDGSPVFLLCNNCNEIVLNNGSPYWNFCPCCGADMRGVDG